MIYDFEFFGLKLHYCKTSQNKGILIDVYVQFVIIICLALIFPVTFNSVYPAPKVVNN